MSRLFIQLSIALVLMMCLLAIFFVFSDFKTSSLKQNPPPIQTLETPMPENYLDEPTVVKIGFKIASSSAWIKIDGETITPSKDTNSITFVMGTVDEVWDKLPQSKKNLESLQLPKERFDFFYNQTLLPTKRNTADLNGDKSLDEYYLSKIVNCTKCYQYFVDIFIKNEVYKTTSNDGSLYPFKDGRGFFITNFLTGTELSTTNPDKVILSRFEWDNNSFKETARKTIYLDKETN